MIDGTKARILQETASVMHNALVVLQHEKEEWGAMLVKTDELDEVEGFQELCEQTELFEQMIDYLRRISK